MVLIVNILTMIGTAIWFVVQKFFPFLVKKFGLGAIKLGIQKAISSVLVLASLAFFGAVLIFISNTYTMFRNVVAIVNSPTSLGLGGGGGSEISCFLHLLHSSGIAAGANAAFSFGITVFIFFFLRGLYSIFIKTLRIISDEVSKNLKLV